MLPPGPRWPALVQTVALMRFRHQFHPWLRKTYGDTYTVRLIPGGRPLVMVTRPEHTKEVFAGDPEVFHAGKGNSILGPVMGLHSLLLQDGAEHKRARKLIMPAFNGQALKGYADLVTDIARDEVAHWPDGARVPLARPDERADPRGHPARGVRRQRRGAAAADAPARQRDRRHLPIVLLGWGYPRLQKFGVWKRTVDNQYELDKLMYAEIRERRVAPDLAERTDVLSRLIRVGTEPDADPDDQLSDTELRDQLVTLLLAGHETTATALAWALYELGRHPDLHARTVGRRARRATTPGSTPCSRSRCGCTRSSRWSCAR